MTVAAVVLAASPASALADAAGTPAVRRIADAAWAGGASPIVVVAADVDGAVAAALATAEAALLAPAPLEGGPVGQIAHGIRGAAALVGATSAVLVWPARFAWADAETVTTLIEAHGGDPASVLRPSRDGAAGWPVLLPLALLDRLAAVAADRMPDGVIDALAEQGVPVHHVETGDPGTTHDLAVAPADLPPYVGPPRTDDDVEREWGAPAADQPDDIPPSGSPRVGGQVGQA